MKRKNPHNNISKQKARNRSSERASAHILFLKQETFFKKFCLGGDVTSH